MFKEKFRLWLEKLARTNAQQFGESHGLECCNMNRNPGSKRQNSSTQNKKLGSAH